MANKIFLTSGHTSTKSLRHIDRKIIEELKHKRVLVLNLSWDDPSKLEEKGEFFKWYFRKELRADGVELLSPADHEDAEPYFRKAGLLYLPGGNAEILLDNIQKKNLASLIYSFRGTIAGNSAGAEILGPDYIKIEGQSVNLLPALRVVDLWVKRNYNPDSKFETSSLSILSQSKKIYGLENPSKMVWTPGGEGDFKGNVWRFVRGKRERIR